MTKYDGLIARLEALTEPDMDVDVLIGVASDTTDIPDDIMKAARLSWDDYSCLASIYPIEITAMAILEERKRCAEIARGYKDRDPAEDGNGWWAADEIAAAIMEGPTT